MFIYLGILVGAGIGLVFGDEIQERWEAHRARRAAAAQQHASRLRMETLRAAAAEAEVRRLAEGNGVDVDQVIRELEAGTRPSVPEQQLEAILRQALGLQLSPEARAAIERLLDES